MPVPHVKTLRVRLECVAPEAESVCIAGTFNDWRPGATPMIDIGSDRWIKDLVLPPGIYEYCFVIDGYKWGPDPRSNDTALNPFGGMSSVLIVTPLE